MPDNNPTDPIFDPPPLQNIRREAEATNIINGTLDALIDRARGEAPLIFQRIAPEMAYPDVIGQAGEVPRMLDDETQWAAAPRPPRQAQPDVVDLEFAEAEPTPNIFARQQSIPLEIPSAVAVVGVGGVGSWIGLMLALAGVPDLWLFDSDTVSEHNLNRTPYGPDAIDKPKTEALKALIATLRPRCKVRCHPNFDQKFAETLGLSNQEFSWLAISTDTWDSRKAAHHWASRRGVNYLEAAAEGEVGSISNAPAEWATADEANPGYASVPVWVGPATCAAWMACNHILHSQNVPDSARMGWSHDRINFTYHERS